MGDVLSVWGVVYWVLLCFALWYRTVVDPWQRGLRLGMGLFYVGIGIVLFTGLETLGLLFFGVGTGVFVVYWLQGIGEGADETSQAP